MPHALKYLADAVDLDPQSPSSAHAMEQVAWDVLERIQRPDQARLSEAAERTDALAKRWTAEAEQKPELHLAWYAGHLQGFALLLRAAMMREIPLSVQAVLGQKNTVTWLRALEEGDMTLSKLATQVGLDLGQAQREVTRLADHDLVRTVKGGRDRWVRLTNLGHRSLAWSRERGTSAGWSRIPLKERAASAQVAAAAMSEPEGIVDLHALLVNMTAQQAEATQRLQAAASTLESALGGLANGVLEVHEAAHGGREIGAMPALAFATKSVAEKFADVKRRINKAVGKEG